MGLSAERTMGWSKRTMGWNERWNRVIDETERAMDGME